MSAPATPATPIRPAKIIKPGKTSVSKVYTNKKEYYDYEPTEAKNWLGRKVTETLSPDELSKADIYNELTYFHICDEKNGGPRYSETEIAILKAYFLSINDSATQKTILRNLSIAYTAQHFEIWEPDGSYKGDPMQKGAAFIKIQKDVSILNFLNLEYSAFGYYIRKTAANIPQISRQKTYAHNGDYLPGGSKFEVGMHIDKNVIETIVKNNVSLQKAPDGLDILEELNDLGNVINTIVKKQDALSGLVTTEFTDAKNLMVGKIATMTPQELKHSERNILIREQQLKEDIKKTDVNGNLTAAAKMAIRELALIEEARKLTAAQDVENDMIKKQVSKERDRELRGRGVFDPLAAMNGADPDPLPILISKITGDFQHLQGQYRNFFGDQRSNVDPNGPDMNVHSELAILKNKAYNDLVGGQKPQAKPKTKDSKEINKYFEERTVNRLKTFMSKEKETQHGFRPTNNINFNGKFKSSENADVKNLDPNKTKQQQIDLFSHLITGGY